MQAYRIEGQNPEMYERTIGYDGAAEQIVQDLRAAPSRISGLESSCDVDNCSCPECPECSCDNVISIPGAAAATSVLVLLGATRIALIAAD